MRDRMMVVGPHGEVFDNWGRREKQKPQAPKGAEMFREASPYNFNRLYGDEKYNLQNMMLNEVNFPTYYYPTDKLYDVWSDRVYTEWGAASYLLDSTQTGDAYFHGVSPEKLLAFASKLFGVIEHYDFFKKRYEAIRREMEQLPERYRPHTDGDKLFGIPQFDRTDEVSKERAAKDTPSIPLTGAAIIRNTNVSSGYPCLYIMGIIADPAIKSRQMGYPKAYPAYRNRMNVYGEFEF